jgi:hypothetical protein
LIIFGKNKIEPGEDDLAGFGNIGYFEEKKFN